MHSNYASRHQSSAGNRIDGTSSATIDAMRRRTRTLIGTIGILIFVLVYAPLAMTLADSRIAETPAGIQAVLYSILGIAWIFPLMPVIRWMDAPDDPA